MVICLGRGADLHMVQLLPLPHWLQIGDAPNSPPKLPLPILRYPPPSNIPIRQPTPLTTPNGIRIQSAVVSQFSRTDRQTHRLIDGIDDRSTPSALSLAVLIDSDTLIITDVLQCSGHKLQYVLNGASGGLQELMERVKSFHSSRLSLGHSATAADDIGAAGTHTAGHARQYSPGQQQPIREEEPAEAITRTNTETEQQQQQQPDDDARIVVVVLL